MIMELIHKSSAEMSFEKQKEKSNNERDIIVNKEPFG